jgi:MYXO-CTERM domain-containing protein
VDVALGPTLAVYGLIALVIVAVVWFARRRRP